MFVTKVCLVMCWRSIWLYQDVLSNMIVNTIYLVSVANVFAAIRCYEYVCSYICAH